MSSVSMEGLLVISDITGYTAFLKESELEHAEDSLRSLLNLLLDHTRPPLVVSRLQGDAVIKLRTKGKLPAGADACRNHREHLPGVPAGAGAHSHQHHLYLQRLSKYP